MFNCLWPCGVLAELSVYLLVINITRGGICENSRLQIWRCALMSCVLVHTCVRDASFVVGLFVFVALIFFSTHIKLRIFSFF